MKINERIKTIRDYFDLTQEQFGARLGYGRAHVSMLETGERRPTERAINDMCRVYGVNREWLTKGIGEMRATEQSFIEAVASSLGHITEEDKELVIAYLQLPADKRKAFWKFLKGLTGNKKR